MKILLFDLDGTLLNSEKTISPLTLDTLNQCRETGLLIGVSTSRSQQNSLKYISELAPDIIVSSGGALITYRNEAVYKAEFSVNEVNLIIRTAREICGTDCEITVGIIRPIPKLWINSGTARSTAIFPRNSLSLH